MFPDRHLATERREESIRRNPESTLKRQKPGAAKIRIAGRGPISAMLRCYVDLPSLLRPRYSIRLGTKNLTHMQIEQIARKSGLI
jgi:hypothetical protein